MDLSNNCQKMLKDSKNIYNDHIPLNTEINGETWYKVFAIKTILKIMSKHRGVPLMLVAGNTAQGVFKPKIKPQVYIDVNDVAELKKCSINKFITLGGNLTLTETMNYLTEISGVKGFKYVEDIVDHIDLVANVPVKNVSNIYYNHIIIIKHWMRVFFRWVLLPET